MINASNGLSSGRNGVVGGNHENFLKNRQKVLVNKIFFVHLQTQTKHGSLGSLAQLVQSVCLTSRGSGVRRVARQRTCAQHLSENRWLIIIYIQTPRTMRHVESDLYAWPFQEPPPRLHERPFPRNMPRTGFWSRSLTLKLLPFRLTGARPHATSGPAMLPGTCCPSKQISSLKDTPWAYSRLPS